MRGAVPSSLSMLSMLILPSVLRAEHAWHPERAEPPACVFPHNQQSIRELHFAFFSFVLHQHEFTLMHKHLNVFGSLRFLALDSNIIN